jgi:hypothetical protein
MLKDNGGVKHPSIQHQYLVEKLASRGRKLIGLYIWCYTLVYFFNKMVTFGEGEGWLTRGTS